MYVWHMGDSFLTVAGDSSQPSYDVQYEVPATEGEFGYKLGLSEYWAETSIQYR